MELRRGVTMMVLSMLSWMLVISSANGQAPLQVGFYKSTCPTAETIVAGEVGKALATNIGLAGGLVRMHFHDCFVRGCDGSVLLDSTATNTAEKDSTKNNPSLRGFEVIDDVKARLEYACPGVVSCADIIAFAARDSVIFTGGVRYEVPSGRRDGRVSLASETYTNLPSPTSELNNLTQLFASKGLTQFDMVTLSGAHTIGRSHCTAFSKRLYNFDDKVAQDPSLDAGYAELLKRRCPEGSTDPELVVSMDPRSPNRFDAGYYNNIIINSGLFTSDQTLVSAPETLSMVSRNAVGERQWMTNFGTAMVKMGQIGVLTGSDGEVRRDCRVVN